MKARLRLGLFAASAAALVALASVKESPVEEDPGPALAAARHVVPQEDPKTEVLEYGAAFLRQPMPDIGHAFQPRSWAPPPPPPSAAAAEPPTPVAPPVPYTFLGRMESDEAPKVFLRKGKDAVLIAAEHDTLEGTWRLEAIGPSGLVLTYLPLNQQKILPYK